MSARIFISEGMTMSKTRLHCILAFCAASGCYVESGPPPAQPAPAAVYQPAAAAAPVAVVEAPPAPPPAPPAEPVPPSPGPDHYWVAGYHRWNGREYVWEKGHYERRPRPNAKYVGGHWEQRGRGRAWVDGHWE
jgi:hypothetical protein